MKSKTPAIPVFAAATMKSLQLRIIVLLCESRSTLRSFCFGLGRVAEGSFWGSLTSATQKHVFQLIPSNHTAQFLHGYEN